MKSYDSWTMQDLANWLDELIDMRDPEHLTECVNYAFRENVHAMFTPNKSVILVIEPIVDSENRSFE